MAQSSVLDRTLAPDRLGDPVVWVPESIQTGLFAQRVAQAARIPIVFEAVADRGGPENGTLQRVSLTGLTVRDALDTLVAADSRYHWAESDGVIVVRPIAATADIENPLNQPVRNVGWDDVAAEHAMHRVMAILFGDDPSLPPSAPPFADDRTFTVRVASGSVLQLLTAAAVRTVRWCDWSPMPHSARGVFHSAFGPSTGRARCERTGETVTGLLAYGNCASWRTAVRRLWTKLCVALALAVPIYAHAQASDEVTYYHTDAIGSVRVVTDSGGQVLARYDYLPFGELWPTSPAGSETRRFGGKERDAESDFDYFGARYYASGNGRFTTVDPVLDIDQALVDPQRWNRYTYVRNNPFRNVDPDGRAIETVWDVISLGMSARAVWQNPTSGWNWVALAADVGSVLAPAIPAVGAAIRGAGALDNVADTSTGLRSISTGTVALDANALINGLEKGERAALEAAMAARTPVVSITAAKEFLVKGDVNVLREFLAAHGGSVGKAATAEQIAGLKAHAKLLGRALKARDAAVAGSALRHNATIITRDGRLRDFLEAAGIAVEGF